MKKPPLGEKNVLNPEEAITYFGFSRRKFYRFLNEGKCKRVHGALRQPQANPAR